MLQRFLLITLTLCSLSATAQWQQTGSKVRYVNGLGIPTKDTAAGVSADSSQIVIRPADSALYIKYKRTWLRVGGGGGSIAGGGTAGQVSFFTGASAIGGDSALFWDNTNKRLGIHTKNPGRNLDVHGTNVIAQFNGTGTNNAYLDFQNAGVTQWRIGNNCNGAPAQQFNILNAAGSNIHFSILQTGNVGINTVIPGAKLEIVNSNSGATVELLRLNNTGTGASTKSRLNFYAASTDYGSITGGYGTSGTEMIFDLNNANGSFIWNSTGTNRMTIDNTGKVGIGYPTPAAKLVVDGTALINTNTDNGLGDKLQVNGSVLSTQFKLSALNTAPATASSTGTLGEIRIDANYIYICTATNTWKRVAIATW